MSRGVLAVLLMSLLLVAMPAFAAQSTLVTTEVVEMHPLGDSLQVLGKVVSRPGAARWLSAGKAGIVGSVFVSPGETVVDGQPLLAILNSPSSQAAWRQAQAALVAAKSNLARVRRLHEEGLAASVDLTNAKLAYENARSNIALMHNESTNKKAHIIKAASAGVVSQWLVSSGQWVAPGQHVASLSPAGGLWVRFGLTPDQLSQVALHDEVLMNNALKQNSIPVKSYITSIASQVDPQTGLIDVGVPVPPDAAGLLLGSWAAGKVSLARMQVPTLDRSAVLKDEKGNYVFVVEDGKAKKTDIKLLMQVGKQVGVSGLKVGDVVVTEGNFGLQDGAAVREKP